MNHFTEDATDRPIPGGTFPLAGRATPRIGYGMGQITRIAEDSEGRARAVDLLRVAFDLGITHFDTAQFYGNGRANELLRESLGPRREEIVIATKAGAKPVPGGKIPLTAAQKPVELRAAVEENLRSLGTDRLDVVNLRRMDFTPGLLAEGDQIVPFEDQLAELSALRDEGKIVAIGLSHITTEQLRTALPVGIACVQNIYNLLYRADEAMLTVCEENGVAWVPYFPLGGGYGTLPKVVDEPAVHEVARQLGATPSQIGLAWQLAHSPNTMLISGTSSADHLSENTRAADVHLDVEALTTLDATGQLIGPGISDSGPAENS
ncbi:aldo/keto reductase [Rhodococcus sp. PAMC28707]|uniref:aldo/keto reductase n=1 Tax=unclassified Rhodococcus (in: high G+C Gram-positive bacteria) TaxID=192944 RepID=UPI00109E15B0|nr:MULTISPECIES: aldo/keto reductase [unclassified Rhodococcus (in: high G+C Gram-positive bacteria)]QCB51780.1 aldo/keto reductase [Rhodococcus sp. PAMC28705]QCB60052.1 aldo/keto reductase [Rhodococcus sp. PAMC28707]